MRVEVPLRMRGAVGGPLVKTHGVGKGRFKNAIVAGGDALQNIGEAAAFEGVELVLAGQVAPGDDDGLERPYGPKRHERGEGFVFADQALTGFALKGEVIAQ